MAIAAPPIEILLVEDNPADVRLTVEAFKEARVRQPAARGAGRRRGHARCSATRAAPRRGPI